MSNIFEDAANYLMEHGWTQRTMKAPDGSVCAMGALWEVAPEEGKRTYSSQGVTSYFSDDVLNATGKLEMFIGSSVPHWNDHRDRTAEDVILAFKELANGE